MLAVAVIVILLLLFVAHPAAAQQVYVVRPGDTLSGIAARFGVTTQALASVNGIANPSRIFAGQVLTIPAASQNFRFHVVQPGEQLRFIAARYGTTWQTLAAINNLSNPNRIFVGQVLRIPPAGAPVVQPPVFGGRYIVQPGDTLSRIAARFGVNMWDVARVNGILNLNRIFAGQSLAIP